MRGNPIKEWIVFSALWLLLLIPVAKLTAFRKNAEESSKSQPETEVTETAISATAILRYTGAPTFIRISQNSTILCDLKEPPSDETEHSLSIAIDDNNAELLLQAEWPDKKRHVLEIELIAEGKEEKKAHCWAEKTLDEIVSFNWH